MTQSNATFTNIDFQQNKSQQAYIAKYFGNVFSHYTKLTLNKNILGHKQHQIINKFIIHLINLAVIND